MFARHGSAADTFGIESDANSPEMRAQLLGGGFLGPNEVADHACRYRTTICVDVLARGFGALSEKPVEPIIENR